MFRESSIESGLEHIVFLAETDLAAIGLGEPLSRGRGDLFCQADLVPRLYRTESETAVAEVTFNDGITVRLPGVPELRLADPSPQAVASGHIGQLALILRVDEALSRESSQFSLFSLEAATTFQYSISRDRTCNADFKSTFLEEIQFADDGWIAQLVLPKEGVVVRRENLALPAWTHERLLRDAPYLTYAPDPARTFRIEEVQIPGPVVPIGATVTIPERECQHPVCVFIGGSGRHDRHGISGRVDLGTHEIADALSERSWMGVRFDTRGAGTTSLGSDVLEAGLETVIDDARAVLEYVSNHQEADRERIALVGHSQGGLVAMELAVAQTVSALVLLATPGRPAEQVLADQIVNRAKWLSLSAEQLGMQLEELHSFLALLRSDEDWDKSRIPERFWYLRHSRHWYAEHLSRDPANLIANVKCPVLICQGAQDFQVSVERDARTLDAAARQAGLYVELVIFDELDHFFKPSSGTPNVDDYYRARHVSPQLISALQKFLESTQKHHS